MLCCFTSYSGRLLHSLVIHVTQHHLIFSRTSFVDSFFIKFILIQHFHYLGVISFDWVIHRRRTTPLHPFFQSFSLCLCVHSCECECIHLDVLIHPLSFLILGSPLIWRWSNKGHARRHSQAFKR
jgi:hypothetical protein